MPKNLRRMGCSAITMTLLIPAFSWTQEPAMETLTNSSVIALVKAGLPSDVIIGKVNGTACRFQTDADSLIVLKRAQVPDDVLRAMILRICSKPVSSGVASSSSPADAPSKVQITQAESDDAKTSNSGPGTLKAKVLLVTRGGDLKPARLGSIALLYLRKGDAKEDTVGQKFLDIMAEIHSTGDQFRRDVSSTASNCVRLLGPAAGCQELLTSIDTKETDALFTVFKTIASRALELNFFVGSLDEDGACDFSIPLPGWYAVVVSGDAGGNKAFWMEQVKIESGQEASLKLSSPLSSFLR